MPIRNPALSRPGPSSPVKSLPIPSQSTITRKPLEQRVRTSPRTRLPAQSRQAKPIDPVSTVNRAGTCRTANVTTPPHCSPIRRASTDTRPPAARRSRVSSRAWLRSYAASAVATA